LKDRRQLEAVIEVAGLDGDDTDIMIDAHPVLR
jgi:hypothetical protein